MYERNKAGGITGYVPENITVRQYIEPPMPQPSPATINYNAPAAASRENPVLTFLRRRSKLLLLGAILGTLYLIFCSSTILELLEAPVGDSAEEIGQAIGTALGAVLLTPFIWISRIGLVFNWAGWLFNVRGLALTSAILFTIALFLGFSWGLGLIPSLVLGYISFAHMKKHNS